MYYLRLLMTEVAWTKDELREALDGKASLLCFESRVSLSTRVVSVNLSFHTERRLVIQKLKLQ